MNAQLLEVAERDGWVCWLCGGKVAADDGRAGPWAPSVDHVVPKARGGGNAAANLRLAHRRCNSRRGSRLPELDWPQRFGVLSEAPLWQALQRATRRRGSWETVAVVPTAARATAAAAWVRTRAALILGGAWSAEARVLTGELYGVALRADDA